jgi:putative membrane protein
MMSGYGGYGMGWFGGFFMIVVWGLAIVGIILLVRWLAVSSKKHEMVEGVADSPLEILKRRYARGEINKEEFEKMKKDLL